MCVRACVCRSNTASKVGELSLSNPSLGRVGGSNSLVVSTAISRLIIITIITYMYLKLNLEPILQVGLPLIL